MKLKCKICGEITQINISKGKPIKLKCKICGEITQINKTVKNGFCGIAYNDNIQWSDFSDSVPPLNENIWARSNTLPKISEYRVIKVCFPFSCKIGEKFNAVFTPAMSAMNGWEDYPEEIEKSAIIYCKFDKTIVENQYCAWIRIQIIDVIIFSDIYKTYLATYIQEPLEKFDVSQGIYTFKYKNWIYYSWSAQGDLGEWKLIYIDDNKLKHLILMGIWNFHEDKVYYGNILNDKSP